MHLFPLQYFWKLINTFHLLSSTPHVAFFIIYWLKKCKIYITKQTWKESLTLYLKSNFFTLNVFNSQVVISRICEEFVLLNKFVHSIFNETWLMEMDLYKTLFWLNWKTVSLPVAVLCNHIVFLSFSVSFTFYTF